MTHKEYNEERNRLEAERNEAVNQAVKEIDRQYYEKLAPYQKERIATMNTKGVEVGDIITDGMTVMKVKRIVLSSAMREENSYIEFIGDAYTKAQKPRKDGAHTFIQQRYETIPTILKKADES